MIDEADDALMRAWAAWDRHPASETTANRMEDQCQAMAASIGTSATELRILLAMYVRKGMNRSQALAKAKEMLGE